MSPLTKTFVILHVILSLLLTAGLIVFVNRTENFKATVTAAQKAQQLAQVSADAAKIAAQDAATAADAAVAQVNTQIAAIQKQYADATSQLSDRDSKLAQAASDKALAAANEAKLTSALQTSEEQKTSQEKILTQARADLDALMKKNSELNYAVSDLTNKLDVQNRERANFQEQLAEQKSQVEKLQKLLNDNGISPNTPGGLRGNGGGAYAINGVVRDVKSVNSIPYATISVGAADNVQKGMQFNVIDRDKGTWLGYLIIDSVEPNEATGKLEGPKINEVRKDMEVRTQL